MRFARSRALFGEDFTKLQNAKVLLLGVGGVGGFCLDCLFRSGIQNVTIVDYDSFEISNQNRQIGSEAVDEIKVMHLQTLYPTVEALHQKVTVEWCESFDFSPYDLVIDAIDDMKAKVALAHHVSQKLISSTGGAKKLDPTKIEMNSIWNTHGDPLAKKFRYELKKSGFKGDFPVAFSPEASRCKDLGSFVGVTGAFGLALCSKAVQEIIA
ncbi:MAG: ThiF family adenylyltransferase [Epsilonproteobacteria bacterium]|nr:ThiF family adenylyltransferase [Campylobacterota bacterium]